MHPRTDHLLSLRDGGPVDVGVREHTANCTECSEHLAELETVQWRLQSLPPVTDESPRGWAGVQARRAERKRSTRGRAVAARIAVAASVAIIAVALVWRTDESIESTSAHAIEHGVVPEAAAVDEALAFDRVAQLQSQSQELDQLLSAIGERPSVERAGSAVPIESLEAQVQWVDHQLSSGGDEIAAQSAEQLWRERVDLMHSLVRLRYVEAQTIAM